MIETMSGALSDEQDTYVDTLANGVRVVTIREPHLRTANVSVFVRSGSQHESKALNGISHVVEHMAFKGTLSRDCQRINLDAERLGADVNAHTDKDHTAFHMNGLREHAGVFIRMLGDIALNSTFPEAELERERQVILHELAEDDDDALTAAFTLFDKTCFGDHPTARPVIGTRRNIERFSRNDLTDYVRTQYSGANIVVAAAGDLDPQKVLADVEAAFAHVARGDENRVTPPVHIGGVSSRRMAGSSQTHAVLGFPIPSLLEDHHASVVAAALFGEGMSSPLMDEIRERRGLVYFAACSADVMEGYGQFVIEASTSPAQIDEFFAEVARLLATHATRVADVDLERARNQIAVRSLRALERPSRRLEAAAQDLFVHGCVRSRAEYMSRILAVDAAGVRSAFERIVKSPVAVAMAGKVGREQNERVGRILSGVFGG